MFRLLLVLLASFSTFAQTNDTILLHARAAIVHGERLRYEPETNKNCLGFWTNPADWAEWKFEIPRPGVYNLEVWQGCGQGNGGSEVRVTSAGQSFEFIVDETGHFQSFIPRKLGRLHFPAAGAYTLEIRPQNKKAAAVMDIRQVRLHRIPVTSDSAIENEMLNARRIVFLGDSITYSGEYIEYLETYLRIRHPFAEFDILNLGLPSETVSGLSEEGHAGGQFPRPNLHERLDRILEKTKPDLIFACYGMNDGIYQPFSQERFAAFTNGIHRLRAKATAANAKVIHITPPTFDAVTAKGIAFKGYNEVLDRYSQWLVDQHAQGWEVIDIHTPMNAHLEEERRNNPNFHLAGDGVHPTEDGHRLIASIVVQGRIDLDSFYNGAFLYTAVQKRQRDQRDSWLSEIGHNRPGIAKGKTLTENATELLEFSVAASEFQDFQRLGSRVLFRGFETIHAVEDGEDVRYLAPQFPETSKLWLIVDDFESNLRLAGQGFHLIRAPADHRSAIADQLVTILGFMPGEACQKLKQVIERTSPAPKDETGRPLIRKLGTVDVDLVECNPIVHDGKLLRFEWVREGYWDNKQKTNYFRFRDPLTGEVTGDFADGHEFGSAFVHDGTVYVTGTFQRDKVNVFASRDLKTWERWNAIPGGKYGIFNTSICKAGDEFVLMFEIDKPAEEAGVAFTARFAKSKNLREWRVTPPEMNYAKNRYTAPHALRWHDGWFYNFYLEAHDGYEMRVVRSRDLIKWDASPLNPVLKASPDDHRIANPKMRNDHRARVANAKNINNSDIDFVEHNGRLHITYSWGNQQGIEHLAEAIYDGPEAEFLKAWFPE